ncbi:MAG: hypothetical protein J1F04_03015 [Oscillospiraceae bacterium]|nr:hypothetical protein [Oscillospiraceae bacterium]
MDILTELKNLGVNIDEAMNRFMNNEGLYIKMLAKLQPNIEKLPVLSLCEAGDNEQALANAHTLKGITGNLSLTPLFNGYTRIVELFRAGKPDDAQKMLKDILPVQDEIVACINKYC